MAFKIRVILDVNEDVIRDLLVDETSSLESLHFSIARSFGFKGQEMASFFRADIDWEQGEEIPLSDMTDTGHAMTMRDYSVKDLLTSDGERLIYVYDFFHMWTFFVTRVGEESEVVDPLPKTLQAIGNPPEKAPEKTFQASPDSFLDEDDETFPEDFEDLDTLAL